MIDLANPQDKVVVVAVMTEKEDMLGFCIKSFSKFNTIILAWADKIEFIPFSQKEAPEIWYCKLRM